MLVKKIVDDQTVRDSMDGENDPDDDTLPDLEIMKKCIENR